MELPELLRKHEAAILAAWIEDQKRGFVKISSSEMQTQCQEFLNLFVAAVQTGDWRVQEGAVWDPVRKMLTQFSRARTVQGFTPSQTATFVFSLKGPLFKVLRAELSDVEKLADQILLVTQILDNLGLFTTEIFQKTREEIILRQREEMLELSTPVVKLWDGILALPMIGTLDSSRTQVVMETLLQKIMDTGSEVAIIDITGVPTVDTLVAQHLIKTVTAARLMGADCIISGIRPQIAATIVHLGVDLGDVTTKATLADAFLLALKRTGRRVTTGSIPARPTVEPTSADMASSRFPTEVRA